MSKKTAEQPAPPPQEAIVKTSDDEAAALAALQSAGLGDDASDGMGEFSPSDFRTPAKLFNLKNRTDADGNKVTQDMFFDSVSKRATSELHLALLHVHKSNLYSYYDNKDQRTVRVCSSFDRVVGTIDATGAQRPCKGCPDAQWKTVDGKRQARCGEVWAAAAYDLDDQQIVMVRFKRTSLDSIRTYLQQHFIGKRPLAGGKRGHFPIYTYHTTLRLEMDAKTGNFALPVFTRGRVFSPPDLVQLAETAEGVLESLAERLADSEASAAEAEGDTSFDTDAMDAEASGERGTSSFIDDDDDDAGKKGAA